MINLKFLTSKTFIVTVLLQVAGPFVFTFGNWANIIQWLSGFGMAYAVWHYFRHLKPQQDRIENFLHRMHLHHLKEESVQQSNQEAIS